MSLLNCLLSALTLCDAGALPLPAVLFYVPAIGEHQQEIGRQKGQKGLVCLFFFSLFLSASSHHLGDTLYLSISSCFSLRLSLFFSLPFHIFVTPAIDLHFPALGLLVYFLQLSSLVNFMLSFVCQSSDICIRNCLY